MPYYIFQIEQTSTAIVRKMALSSTFEQYRDAKLEIRKLRAAQVSETQEFKMIFAESELQAEELLQEKREAPILMEWEK